ncbi:MAG: tRNA lysidine(34) synthetase TilS [Pseudomonadota bacterium]
MFRLNRKTPAAEPFAPLLENESDDLFSSLENYASLLIAVSGGGDSMALLTLVDEWRKRNNKNIKLVAVSVDHRLRAASAEECRFVARFCEARSISHLTVAWEDEKPVTAIQESARAARYELLAQTARAHNCEAIVTAHTQDDQAETILMRLARGSGVIGLKGMNAMSQKCGLPLLRPLLGISRERLRASLIAAGVMWCEDDSNEDKCFLRPRLRRLLPLLAQEGLDAARFTKISGKLARANDALDHFTQSLFDHVRERQMERSLYRSAPAEIRLRLLQKMIASLHALPYMPGDDQLEDLDTAICSEADMRRTLAGVIFSAGSRYLRFQAENDPRKTGHNVR